MVSPRIAHTGREGDNHGASARLRNRRAAVLRPVPCRYPGPDGRRYTAPVTFVTKTEARGWLALQHAEITRKRWAPPEATTSAVVTFGDYAQEWLAHRDLKPRSREHYAKLLDEHLLPAFGPVALGAITAESVRSWHAGVGPRRRRCARTATDCCAPSWPPRWATG